ncbi:flagellar hook-basal body protein [Sulfuricurvum sp.]|uniref:flagellar hook-basal body protein n=1 Tax=Sulfuricurvum sp. TaxID=2025608 RepID=UPI003BAF9B08
MQTGYYAATAGMVAQFNRMDTIASNLANANTTGYKRDQLITGDFVRLFKEAQSELPIQNQTEAAAQYLNRSLSRVPQITDAYTDQSLGSMQQTGNTFDMALSKEGQFFAVSTPQGVRLTRDGTFTLSDQGKLVNKQGHEVLSTDYFQTKTAITLNPGDSIVTIDKNGQISTNVPGSNQMIANKKILVVEPQNIRMLMKEGDNLYVPDSTDPLTPLADSGSVMQGFTERSNVNAVNEMISLVEANRLVGMYQKAMDTQMNDMNRDAIEKIATTRR